MQRQQRDEAATQVHDRRLEEEDFSLQKHQLEEDERSLPEPLDKLSRRQVDVQLLCVKHVVTQASIQVVVGLMDQVQPGEIAFAEVGFRDKGHLDLGEYRPMFKKKKKPSYSINQDRRIPPHLDLPVEGEPREDADTLLNRSSRHVLRAVDHQIYTDLPEARDAEDRLPRIVEGGQVEIDGVLCGYEQGQTSIKAES